MTEEYFPRGGKKPNATYFKQSSNFLGAAEKVQGKKKKQKQKNRSEHDDGYLSDEVVTEVDHSYQMCAAGIGEQTIKPGVNILGRVRRVFETKLLVALPSKMDGTVMACHISQPYNSLLEAYVNDQTDKVRDLRDMFRPGQYVALQVLESSGELMLSAMPQHVNGARTHADLHKGDILQAAVASVEDHGYVMDLGVPHARAFLARADANPELELDTGMITWTCVKTNTAGDGGSVVALSGALPALQKALRRKKGPLPPASAVEFLVEKSLDNGIEGRVLGGTAYVQRFHADTVKGKKPALGQKLRAYVLYVMPTRNQPFLTMREIFRSTCPDLGEEMLYKEGDIVEEAQVVKIARRSIHFRLAPRAAGTMSLQRVAVDEDLSDEQVIAQSYPIGSTHRVRVLAYNLSDYIYHVSDQPAVLAEKYFRLEQLPAGTRALGRVRSVAEKHLTVMVGRLSGLVLQTHLSDAGVYVEPKQATTSKLTKKYKVGQEVAVRVLSCAPARQTLLLTLKPALLAAGVEALATYEQAQLGKSYTGYIKLVRDYVLVAFFGDVVAYVPRDKVSSSPPDSLAGAFHLGQTVNCTVLNVDPENKKMLGSLITPPFWPAPRSPYLGKRKTETAQTEAPSKKRKPEKEDETEETAPKQKKDKADKKNKLKEISEESDAIETDIYEDSDQVLKPEDKALIDLSDCITPKQWRKRVVSLNESIKCGLKRIQKIDKKIASIEEKGLTTENKKYHTALHQEKLVIEERNKKFTEALELAQEKVKNTEEYKDPKKKKKNEVVLEKEAAEDVEPGDVKKKKKKKEKSKEIVTNGTVGTEEDSPKKRKRNKEKKQEVVEDNEDITVVDSLVPALDVPSAKDFWSEDADNLVKQVQEESSSSSEEEEKEVPKKKRKKLSAAEKDAKARAEEERLRELERRAAEGGAPRSCDQFERALLASPACSQLWVAYMAFHLQATEVEKARAVGRRALAAIPFREEGEKLNVWLAMLNFEYRFGTKESQQKTLEEALQMNEPFKVHSKLLEILEDTSPAELPALAELMLRKYRRQPRCYVACGAACFRAGLLEPARRAMQKAIGALEKKEHVDVLVQFALLERAHGSRERAEALFEQVLAVYPRRVDVAAAYADMLHAARQTDQLRQMMERMTSQKLPARKIKVLYNKWIELEERAGNTEQAELVRERALQFIEKAKF